MGLSNNDIFKARNQYVGLAGGFGTVMLGKRDTAFKDTSNKIDLFNDHSADVKVLWEGENREEDSITYYTPSFGQFKLALVILLKVVLTANQVYRPHLSTVIKA